MPNLPAICESCGAIFPSGFVMDYSLANTLKNIQSGPCPKCGGMGRIPDGVYDVVGSFIHWSVGAPSKELLALRESLLDAARRRAAPDEVASRFAAADVPELRKLADALPKKRSELYTFIALLISAITLVLSQRKDDKPAPVQITVEQVINITINQSAAADVSTSQPLPQPRVQPSQESPASKVGRNVPCPCGSGKKFKRCHGMQKNTE